MAKFDWDYWRYRYVTGEDALTLEALSHTPGAPSLDTLKRYSRLESWPEQRKRFRHQAATIAVEDATAQEAVRQVQKLFEASEVVTRHLQLAKALQTIAAKRLRNMDPEELTPKEAVAWIQKGTQLERLAIGLATDKTEIELIIDYNSLSDEQLQRIAAGEDPRHVLT